MSKTLKAYSPIRGIQGSRLEEELLRDNKRYEARNYMLEEQNQLLRKKLSSVAVTSENQVGVVLQENNRLRNELDFMSIKNQTKITSDIQTHRSLAEENSLLTKENAILKVELDAALKHVKVLEIELGQTKTKLSITEREQISEIEVLKKKYTALHEDDNTNLKMTHADEIRVLLEEIDRLKIQLADKTTELQLQFQDRKELQTKFDSEIVQKEAEISVLKLQLQAIETNKNREIRDLSAKRDLEKSRTTGIIMTSKQTATYLEKELRRLTEEIAEKNTQLEALTKSYIAEKKKNEESTRLFNQKLTQVRREYQQLIRDKITQFEKRETILKEEILDLKKKQTELYMAMDKLDKEIEVLKHELELASSANTNLEEEIRAQKAANEKQREEHIREITKLMSEKIRRRSSKMLSSQRSLGSMRDSNMMESPPDQTVITGQLIEQLPTVKEEIYLRESKKQSVADRSLIDEEGNEDMANIVNHFEGIIEQLKKSHSIEMEMLRMENRKLGQSLREKQSEYEDLLNRFAPLVKIHAGEKTIQQDRQERLQRHYKADITLLEVLLQKHKIQL